MHTVLMELESSLNMHLCYDPNPTCRQTTTRSTFYTNTFEFGMLPVWNETSIIDEHDQHIKGQGELVLACRLPVFDFDLIY